jgi:hypothetical protein
MPEPVSEPASAWRVLASGATQLWADGVRQGDRRPGLGDGALETGRPLHLASAASDLTLCGLSCADMIEYRVEFSAQEPRIQCPACAAASGRPPL